MNISLFGGAFDPPHNGHTQVTHALLAENIADEVWYLPVKNHHFGKKMSDINHRLAMLQLIVNHPRIRIELYETRQEGINYTYQTMKALASENPQHNFSFVIGSDNLGGYHRWLEKHPQLLEFPFYVYPREGFSFEPLYPNMTALKGFQTVKVSSTEIRDRVQKGQSITGLVDPKVEQYIIEQKLYSK